MKYKFLKDLNFDLVVNSTIDVDKEKILIIDNKDQIKLDQYISEALQKKVTLVLTSNESKLEDKQIIKVKDFNDLMENILIEIYKDYQKLNYFAITGTNGKTTTGYYLDQLIKKSSIFVGTLNQENLFSFTNEKNLTTPKLFNLVKMLSLQKQQIQNIVLEMSSHALHQNRLEGIKFVVSGFTNLTQDHLDYHKSFNDYFLAKAKLFDPKVSSDFVFIDNEYGNKINDMYSKKGHSIGVNKLNDVQILESSYEHIKFRVENEIFENKLNISGPECYSNLVLGASMAYYSELFSFDEIIKNIPQVKNPPGRFDIIDSPKGTIIIDYSHSPDSIEKVIKYTLQKYSKKIIVVFGAGGDRDSNKRKYMGQAVNLADEIILTDDNPRTEDPNLIINDIIEGIELNKKLTVINDRYKAIEEAFNKMNGDCILLILGKGHEIIQEFNDKDILFNDKEVVLELISNS